MMLLLRSHGGVSRRFRCGTSNVSSLDGGVERRTEEVGVEEERKGLWDDVGEQDCISCNDGANSSYILQRWHKMLSHTSSEAVTSKATSELTSASSQSSRAVPSSPSSQSSIQQPSSFAHASFVASTTPPLSTSSDLPRTSQSSTTLLLISPSQTAHVLSTSTSTPSVPPQTSTSSTSSPHTVLVGSILGGVSRILLLFCSSTSTGTVAAGTLAGRNGRVS
ncbi:hypothetical protein BT69DRAFT_908370 [Atractiella rhizophila]|nr:hypothetical protein BT69DRAFT_908370 [Atractiella rhizophila]